MPLGQGRWGGVCFRVSKGVEASSLNEASEIGVAKRQIMRNGQNNKRMRGRNNNNNNNRKSSNPLTRVYESNGPDIKIRGTASHVAEKYIQLARDSQASGDPVAAENYYQHAEHYFRAGPVPPDFAAAAQSAGRQRTARRQFR